MKKRILYLTLFILALFALSAPAGLADGGEPAPEAAETAPASGWAEQNGLTYYYIDGVPAVGWQTIDGAQYYFRPDGRRACGWTLISGRTYYFGSDGLPYTGLRYVHETGKMYLFSSKGVLQKGRSVFVYGRHYTASPSGALEGYLNNTSAMAAAVLDQIGWDLRAAFDWCAGMPYYDRENRAPDDAVHSEWYATYGFSYRYGNCYVMAATFYQMARLLGCDVYYIEGGVGSYNGAVIDHSWTEMVIDGELYVFDPDFTNEEGADGFQIWYEKPGTWWYWQPVRVP